MLPTHEDMVHLWGEPPWAQSVVESRQPDSTMLPPPNGDLQLPSIAPLAEPPTVPAPPPDEDRAALIEAIRVLSRDSAIMTETLRHAQTRSGELLERCRAAEADAALNEESLLMYRNEYAASGKLRASRNRWRKQARADMVELRRLRSAYDDACEKIADLSETDAERRDRDRIVAARDQLSAESAALRVACQDWEDVAIGREKERARYAAQLRNLTEAIGVDPDGELATERAIDAAKELRSVAARQRAVQSDNSCRSGAQRER